MAQVKSWPWFKIVVVVYIAIVLGLIGSYIGISTLDIQVSAYVQAPKTLEVGKAHAVRGFFLNAATGQMFGQVRAQFTSAKAKWGGGKTGKHGYLQTKITPTEPGEQVLRLTAKHPYFEEDYVVDTPVTVVKGNTPRVEIPTDVAAKALWLRDILDRDGFEPPTFVSRLPQDKQDWKKHSEFTGELEVDALPGDAELVRGLPNVIFLRVTRKQDGQPVRARITFEKIEGHSDIPIRESYQTDDLGLVRIELKPIGSIRWTVRAESLEPRADGEDIDIPDTGKGSVSFASVPAQFSLRMRRSWVVAGAEAEGIVYTLYRNGGFMVDLYDGARWVDAGAFGINAKGGGLVVKIPEVPSSPVMRVQVYESVFDPSSAWDSKNLAVIDEASDEACWRGLKRVLKLDEDTWSQAVLAKLAGKRSGDAKQCEQWLEAALLALPTHFEPAPLLVNSQQAEREALEAWKENIKSDLLILTIFALLIGLAGLFLLVQAGVQTSIEQREAMRMIDLEFDGEDAPIGDSLAARMDRYGMIARVVVLIGTIVLFVAGVIMVLMFL